jgi:hypothetical protein
MSAVSSSDYAVVDARVWVSYLLDEDLHHTASEQWLDDWLLDDGTIVIPLIALPEVAGATLGDQGTWTPASQGWPPSPGWSSNSASSSPT